MLRSPKLWLWSVVVTVLMFILIHPEAAQDEPAEINLENIQQVAVTTVLSAASNPIGRDITWSSDGQTLMVHTAIVKLYQPPDFQETFLELENISYAVLMPDNPDVLALVKHDEVILYNMVSKKEEQRAPHRFAKTIGVSPDSTMLVSGGSDGSIYVWDAKTLTQLAHLSLEYDNSVRDILFNETLMVVTAQRGAPHIWQLDRFSSGESIYTDTIGTLIDVADNTVIAAAFSPSGTLAVGFLQLIPDTTETSLQQLTPTITRETITFAAEAVHEIIPISTSAVTYNPQGDLLVSGDAAGFIHFWDAATGELLRSVQEHTGEVYQIAFSPDGTYMVSSSRKGEVFVWTVPQP